MTVHVLIREDQNHYGFIDTSIVGLFTAEHDAVAAEAAAHVKARAEGLRLEVDTEEADWQVCWRIELHDVV